MVLNTKYSTMPIITLATGERFTGDIEEGMIGEVRSTDTVVHPYDDSSTCGGHHIFIPEVIRADTGKPARELPPWKGNAPKRGRR